MTRRKSFLGLAIVAALCLSAFGASSAMAAQTGYTLHECVPKGSKGTGVEYNTNCVAKTTGGGFETLPVGTTAFTGKATGTSSFTLSTTVGGVFFSITCTGLEATPKLQNVLTGEFMHVTDEGATTFTGCSVATQEGACTVPATLKTVNLKSDTNEAGSTKFTPATGDEFITIEVGGEKCPAALKGKKVVKGTATSARETGLTQAFTEASGSSLTFGSLPAKFTGKYHLSTSNGTLLSLEKAGE